MTEKRNVHSLDRGPLIVAGIALLMVACFVALICVPDHREHSELSARIEAAEQQLAAEMKEVEGLPQIAERVAANEPRYEETLLRLPRESRVPDFIGEVADILATQNVSKRDIVPDRPRATEQCTELPVRIRFEAPFAVVFAVLAELEMLTRINHVDEVKLSHIEGMPGHVLAELTVVIYYAPESTGAATVAARTGGTRG